MTQNEFTDLINNEINDYIKQNEFDQNKYSPLDNGP